MEINIVFAFLWMFVCYKMAEKRNRNPVLGAVSGAIFGLLAVIYYAIVGVKKDK